MTNHSSAFNPTTTNLPPAQFADVLCAAETLMHQGQLQEAQTITTAVLKQSPYEPTALNLLGLILLHQQQPELAATKIRQAVTEAPYTADYHYNLGCVLVALDQLESAHQSFEQALALNPNHAAAHNNLGATLLKQKRYPEAQDVLLAAIERDPDNSSLYSNLGSALREQGNLEDARAVLEYAVQLNPQLATAWSNLGDLLCAMGHSATGVACFERALALNPQEASALNNQAHLMLGRGNLVDGWPAYEARKRLNPKDYHRYPFAQWNGEDLSEKTVLVYAEQGVGDEVLYAHCFPDLIGCARQVVIDCDPRLATLFARSFPQAKIHPVARKISQDEPLPVATVDYQVAAGSLPGFFRQHISDFLPHQGYLNTDPARVDYWRQQLAALGVGRKIGFAWRSGLLGVRRGGYTEISDWAPMFGLEGFHWINLQYGDCRDELDYARQHFNAKIIDFGEHGLNLKDDLDDCAALYQALDLVIAPNTAITSVAGAVGAKVWVLSGGWIQLGQGGQLPWYPSLQIVGNRGKDAVCSTKGGHRALAVALDLAALDQPQPTPDDYWQQLVHKLSQHRGNCEGIGYAVVQDIHKSWDTAFVWAMLDVDRSVYSPRGQIKQALLHGYLGEFETASALIESAYAQDDSITDGFVQLAAIMA